MSDTYMPDLDEINEQLATDAIGPQSASVDGQSATDRSASDKLKLIDRVAANQANGQTNSNGGKRTGWGFAGYSRFKPQGGGPE